MEKLRALRARDTHTLIPRTLTPKRSTRKKHAHICCSLSSHLKTSSTPYTYTLKQMTCANTLIPHTFTQIVRAQRARFTHTFSKHVCLSLRALVYDDRKIFREFRTQFPFSLPPSLSPSLPPLSLSLSLPRGLCSP